MLERNIIILISAVAVALICWMIVENRFCSFGSFSREKTLGTASLRRINISVEKFFDAVNSKKDFRTPRLESEMSKIQVKTGDSTKVVERKNSKSNHLNEMNIKKINQYNRRENM